MDPLSKAGPGFQDRRANEAAGAGRDAGRADSEDASGRSAEADSKDASGRTAEADSADRGAGTKTTYHGRIRIVYPLERGRIVLRTEADWTKDLEPTSTQGNQRFDFEVTWEHPYLNFKPCVYVDGAPTWSTGPNKLALLGPDRVQSFYPNFKPTPGRITDIITLASASLGDRRLRVYLPGGYDENTLKHYPVLYMQDGANVFFPEEAFQGQDWNLDRTVDLLGIMNLIDQTIVVAVYPGDRMKEYTKPGYEEYARVLVTEVKPYIDSEFRTLPGRRNTIVMGSSLGGAVAFYLAWGWPDVIGNAACLSSAFSWKDDLIDRVRTDEIESRRDLRVYLDSGWPHDNYEATLSMASALVERGFVLGRNVHYLAFPFARHDELSWASRCHVPLQLFAGRLRRAAAQRAFEESAG